MKKIPTSQSTRRRAKWKRDAGDDVCDDALAEWEAGRHDEAYERLTAYLTTRTRLTTRSDLRCRVALAMVQRSRGHYRAALRIHEEDARLAARCPDLVLRGKYHAGLARCYDLVGEDDRAFTAYTAAATCYEQAREWALRAGIENNLAVLHLKAGRYAEARRHLRRALRGADDTLRAEIEDTRAAVALAEGDERAGLRDAAASVFHLLSLERETGRLVDINVETLEAAINQWKRARARERLRDALVASGWDVTKAARRLGYQTRQALAKHLRRHFPELDRERRERRNLRVASS